MLWTSILGVGTNGVYLHPHTSSQRLLPQKWHHVLLLVPESQTDLLLGIILPWASLILKLHFHSHLKLPTSLTAPNGELTSAAKTPVRPFGFRLVFSSLGKHNGRQSKAGTTEQRANESLLSARLSGDQMLPQLGPSFNANGHLHEVKEWFWLSQSHDFHTHAHYLLTHEWYNDKWGIDALKTFHHNLSSPLLYHPSMLHFYMHQNL